MDESFFAWINFADWIEISRVIEDKRILVIFINHLAQAKDKSNVVFFQNFLVSQEQEVFTVNYFVRIRILNN